ncbi:hypothetical protein [Streptomyces sp. NBC_00932]|uniref:hypothetical protein n=1 Tax=Streptomyces sp. NBC_00932 TaxID=2903690 RepID=UPI00386B52D4|nr:hypothetical protein OG221_27690 [Streptomyces sp. NBC_00932]
MNPRTVRTGRLQVQSPMSDDLWSALHQHRPTACQDHRAWVDRCAPLHQLAGGIPGGGKLAGARAMLAEAA